MLRSLRGDRIIARAYEQASIGSPEDALTMLRRAARNSDPRGKRMEAMGMILYQHGRWQEAANAFDRALAKAPADMSRLNFLCSSLARSGQADLALARLDDYAARHPMSVAPPCIRCLILADKQDYTAARSAYEKARHLFAQNHAQDSLAMGFLQQCAEILPEFPPDAEKRE